MPSFWLKLLAYGWLVALFFNKECPLQILVPKEAYMHGSDLYLCGMFSVWFLCLLRTCTRNAHTGRCQLACNSVMLMCPAVSISAYVPNYQLSESVKLLCISRLSNRCQNKSLSLCLLETGLFIHWASCSVSRWHYIVVPNSPWSGPDGSLDAQLSYRSLFAWQCWCNHRNARVINRPSIAPAEWRHIGSNLFLQSWALCPIVGW